MAEQVSKSTLRTDVFGSRAKTCVPFKSTTLTILLCLLVTSLSYGDEGYQKGMVAYQRGDYTTALKEFRPLAEQGHAEAQFQLGVMYDAGQGVMEDYVEAHMWFNLAAAQGNEEAREDRNRVAKKMTVSQIVEAQRRAREWKRGGDGSK